MRERETERKTEIETERQRERDRKREKTNKGAWNDHHKLRIQRDQEGIQRDLNDERQKIFMKEVRYADK